MGGQTDVRKLIVTFHNLANAPKNVYFQEILIRETLYV
jgi:hypothetical protein